MRPLTRAGIGVIFLCLSACGQSSRVEEEPAAIEEVGAAASYEEAPADPAAAPTDPAASEGETTPAPAPTEGAECDGCTFQPDSFDPPPNEQIPTRD